MSKFDNTNLNIEQMKEYYKNQMLEYNKIAKGRGSFVTQPNTTYDSNDYNLAAPVMAPVISTQPAPTPAPQPVPAPAPTPTPAPAQPSMTVEEKYHMFLQEHPAKGYLKAQAFTARRTYPVPDVVVEIYKKFDNEKYLIATLKTDLAGQTDTIPLHTVDKNMSETPGGGTPYVTYDMRATHPGFLPANYYNIPIFDTILSTQPIDLIPEAVAPEGMREESFFAREPEDL